MKIARLDTFHVEPRWLFLRITTDSGLEGWGEPVVEGFSRSVAVVVQELGEMIIGQDARRVEHLWQLMYRSAYYRGGAHIMSAISGIEQALWDLKGKALGVPVYEMLGGHVRDRVRMYGHVGDLTIDGAQRQARELIARGFDAVKAGISAPLPPLPKPAVLDAEAARIHAIRQAIGPEVDLALDFHGRLSPDAAISLISRIEDARPLFVEEPVLPENVDSLVRVQRATRVPIATGERLFTRWGFREVLEKQAASVLQPDLSHAGGIAETRRIAAMAEIYFASIAPHNPLGPIALAASLQVAVSAPNFLIQEHPTMPGGQDLGAGLLAAPFRITGGHIERPTAPGLGIEVDLEGVLAREFAGDWRTPQLLHEDGSAADW